jgi:lysozyme
MSKGLHRWFNTSVSTIVLTGLVIASTFGYTKYTELDNKQIYSSEMNQITNDEGFKKCSYNDSLGYQTIGFGHLVKHGEDFNSCITMPLAFDMLHDDYYIAVRSVEHRYSWAEGEVKLVLVNMSYQLGGTRLAKFKKTLIHLENKDYRNASIEMLDSTWAKQTERRALRLAVRILSLKE